MPLYEYKCTKCGDTQEVFRSVSEMNNGPECACGTKTEKQLSRRVATRFIGPGFYCNDDRANKEAHVVSEALAEGPLSDGEMEEGVGQGIERAAKLGVKPERIIGHELAEKYIYKTKGEEIVAATSV